MNEDTHNVDSVEMLEWRDAVAVVIDIGDTERVHDLLDQAHSTDKRC